MLNSISLVAVGLAAAGAAQSVSDKDLPYLGCYEIQAQTYNPLRDVYASTWQKSGDGIARCKSDCRQLPGFKVMGMSPVGCFCAMAGSDNLKLVDDAKCNVKCRTDGSDCGGTVMNGKFVEVKYVSLYGDAAAALPPALLNGLGKQSCYTLQEWGNINSPENPITALEGPSYSDAAMTVNSCAEFCVRKHNKKIIHLVDGNKCHCADAHLDTAVAGLSSCSTKCAGNKLQVCGGNDHPSQQGIYASTWEFS